MSERSLARLMVAETGMTFGRWRQQLRIIVALQRLFAGAISSEGVGGTGLRVRQCVYLDVQEGIRRIASALSAHARTSGRDRAL